MMPAAIPAVLALLLGAAPDPVPAATARCIGCHQDGTPGIVSDWRLSRHAEVSVGCEECHGTAHGAADDAARAKLPTPATCARCHPAQMKQYEGSKHALAWAAMMAMPTFHYQPPVFTDGLEGCGGCHAIGLKEAADEKAVARVSGRPYGAGACASCHTRHTFSVKEAREPQACKSCHMGFDHAQWEMYDASKHGVRHELVQLGALPRDASAPTCQTCHMQGGDHGVVTGWGFLGVRLPLPDDPRWKADQVTILKALGVLDPAGKPTTLLEVVKAARMARVTQEEWQALRARMIDTCKKCHSGGFAASNLSLGDRSIQEADRLMAEAVEIVAGLYRDGLLRRSKEQPFDYPSILQFHDAPSVVEQRLFVMFSQHRMRTFQGAFHQSPDHALWDGWSEMQRDLAEIRERAARMRTDREVERRLGPPASERPAANPDGRR
jgi:nitrate/TMAO reductase-like tetraheme cytochrome c subunit